MLKNPSPNSSIPTTILKQSIEIHLPSLTNAINYTVNESKLPDKLKKLEVIPLYKKEENY